MSFFGDLASLSLTDLLQNLENNGHTGTLAIQSARGRAYVFAERGKVAMLARDGRPELIVALAGYGLLSPAELDAVRARRRGSRRSLVETMVDMDICGADTVRQAATAILVEELCELILGAQGEFRFDGGDPPARIFDPEERRLGLAIGVGALLLEAASRSDHWKMARSVIPSDAVHFIATPGMVIPEEVADPALAARLAEALDGSRNVDDVLSLFAGRRLEAFQTLAVLVRTRAVQAVDSDGILALASNHGARDPARARRLIAQALKEQPTHEGLLGLEAQLAAKMDDRPGAAAALKVLAHQRLLRGEKEQGRDLLARAREWAPSDSAIRERLLALYIEDGNDEKATAEGLDLVKLYRAPGLHAKAREVLELLVDRVPNSTPLRVDLARSQVEAGDPKAAVRGLCRHGQTLVGREEYKEARRVFEQVLRIDAGHKDAKQCIAMIDSETFRRRRERRRRLIRRAVALLILAMVGAVLVLDVRARIDFAEAASAVASEELIENRRYDEVISRFQSVCERHPYTPTALFEIRARIRDLEARACPTHKSDE